MVGEYYRATNGRGKFHWLQRFDRDLAFKVIRDGQIIREIEKRTFMTMSHEQMIEADQERGEWIVKAYQKLKENKMEIDAEEWRFP